MISIATLHLHWLESGTSGGSIGSPGCCGLRSEMSAFLRFLHFNTRYSSLCCIQCSHESPLAWIPSFLLHSDTSCLEVHYLGTLQELHFQTCSVHEFFDHCKSLGVMQMLFSQEALLNSYPFDFDKSSQICLPIALCRKSCISEIQTQVHLAC